MPLVGFEPMIPVFERAKTFRSFDRTHTMPESYNLQSYQNITIRHLMHTVHISLADCKLPYFITTKQFVLQLLVSSLRSAQCNAMFHLRAHSAQ
jgi:hypothetical protein